MNWEALGAIGETLGAVAVFITLAYLAVQVGHARRETQRSIRQHREETLRELLLEPTRNSELVRVVTKADMQHGGSGALFDVLQNRFDLTREELWVFTRYHEAWWFYRAGTISNIEALNRNERENFDRFIRGQYSTGASRVWWECWKQVRSADDSAVRYVDNLLAQPAPTQ